MTAVKWEYPGGACQIELPVYERMALYLETPPLEISIKAHYSRPLRTEIGVSVPLFFSPVLRGDAISHILMQAYIKRVFWLAYEVATFTDLKSAGVGFYLLVEEPLRPLVEPYRELCEFPEDHIITIPSLSEEWRGYMQKVVMLRHLHIHRHFTYYLNMDVSQHWHETQYFWSDLETAWNETPNAIIWSKNPFDVLEHQRELTHSDTVRANWAARGCRPEDFYTAMPRLFGVPNYESLLDQVWQPMLHCPGHFYGIPRSHFASPEFHDFFDFVKENRCLGVDESFWAYYWHRYLSPDRSVFIRNEQIGTGHSKPFRNHRVSKAGLETPELRENYIEFYRNINNDENHDDRDV